VAQSVEMVDRSSIGHPAILGEPARLGALRLRTGEPDRQGLTPGFCM
jgi:hypothetical protein